MGSEITILKQMNNLGFGPFGSITLNLVFTVSLGEGFKQKKLEFSNFLGDQEKVRKCCYFFLYSIKFKKLEFYSRTPPPSIGKFHLFFLPFPK